jgi:short-subunit dehydrogenase
MTFLHLLGWALRPFLRAGIGRWKWVYIIWALFALTAFTSILRMALAGTGISVSLVSPGYTRTEWDSAVVQRRLYVVRSLLRPMSPDRVARVIVRCADRPKREVLIPRILMLTVWLQAPMPGLYEALQVRFRR